MRASRIRGLIRTAILDFAVGFTQGLVVGLGLGVLVLVLVLALAPPPEPETTVIWGPSPEAVYICKWEVIDDPETNGTYLHAEGPGLPSVLEGPWDSDGDGVDDIFERCLLVGNLEDPPWMP